MLGTRKVKAVSSFVRSGQTMFQNREFSLSPAKHVCNFLSTPLPETETQSFDCANLLTFFNSVDLLPHDKLIALCVAICFSHEKGKF